MLVAKRPLAMRRAPRFSMTCMNLLPLGTSHTDLYDKHFAQHKVIPITQ